MEEMSGVGRPLEDKILLPVNKNKEETKMKEIKSKWAVKPERAEEALSTLLIAVVENLGVSQKNIDRVLSSAPDDVVAEYKRLYSQKPDLIFSDDLYRIGYTGQQLVDGDFIFHRVDGTEGKSEIAVFLDSETGSVSTEFRYNRHGRWENRAAEVEEIEALHAFFMQEGIVNE